MKGYTLVRGESKIQIQVVWALNHYVMLTHSYVSYATFLVKALIRHRIYHKKYICTRMLTDMIDLFSPSGPPLKAENVLMQSKHAIKKCT